MRPAPPPHDRLATAAAVLVLATIFILWLVQLLCTQIG